MSGYNAVLARNTENAPKCAISSQTVAFSHYNHFSAQLPIDPKTGKLVAGGVKEQAEQCFKNIKAIVESINYAMSDVMRITVFLTDTRDLDIVDDVQASFFLGYVPTRTVVTVAALPMGAKVQVEAVVANGLGTIPNAPQADDLIKLVNNTCNAPIDPLSSQTVSFSHYNNLSAQLPIEPKSGRILVEHCVKGQAEQCFKNIKAILTSIDVPFDDIVKVNIFLTKLSDAEAVDEVYKTFFPDSAIARTVAYYPARTIIPVADLPMGAMVSVEVVVSHGDGTPPQIIEDRHGLIVEPVNTEKAPICPLSTQTVAFSHYNNISGQLPIDPKSGKLVSGGIKEQAEQCLNHIKAIVECTDHKMDDVVRICIYAKNLSDMEAVDEVYKKFFPSYLPARRVVGVSELPKGALIQMDAVVANEEGTPPLLKGVKW